MHQVQMNAFGDDLFKGLGIGLGFAVVGLVVAKLFKSSSSAPAATATWSAIQVMPQGGGLRQNRQWQQGLPRMID